MNFGDRRLPSRFWAKVREEASGCWKWTAATSVKGYGRFAFDQHNRLAHRVAYESLVASIPAGLQIDHLCRNRACVNPSHLEPVTPRENVSRSPLLGLGNKKKTHCPQGHPYSPQNTYVDPLGGRHCRTCGNGRASEYKRRKTQP